MSKEVVHEYSIRKSNGDPVDPERMFVVLELNSEDEEHAKAAQEAVMEYAIQIKDSDPKLFSDLGALVRQVRRGENRSSQSVFHATGGE